MKILKFKIFLFILITNIIYSQNVTIDYSTFTSNSCNVFSTPVSINGISHQTTYGNPQYNNSTHALVMGYDYNDGNQKGTEFKIAYNIKQDYQYIIKVT